MRRSSLAVLLVVTTLGLFAGPAAAKDYKVGQTATSSDLKFTVYGIQNPWVSPNQFTKPKAGNHFVIVDVEVKNSKKVQQLFSSLNGFHLADGQKHQYDRTLFAAGLPAPTPEGQIAPKSSIRGWVPFEIPDTATGLRLRVQGSFTASGAYFKLQ